MQSRLRHQMFHAGFATLAALRADRWLAPLARGSGAILTFHHVRPEPPAAFAPNALLAITPDCLDRTLRLLAERDFEIISIDSLPERLRAPGPRPFAVLTFDDGYRDNAVHAAPILARHGAPWTLFVAADFASGRGRLWWIELERAIAVLDQIRISLDEGGPIDLPSQDPDEKSRAFDIVYRLLRAGSEELLRNVIARLCKEAGIATGAIAPELCMGWDELRSLAANPAVTIGAHTLSHPMLAKHPHDIAHREIAESRAIIERESGRPVRHLSYPVGDPTSAGIREFVMARDLGFETAVTTRPGHLFPDHAGHLHALPRVSVNGLHQSDAALQSLLSGVPFLAWNRGRRLNVG